MTSPIMISSAGLDRAYPPFGPFFDRRKPLLRTSSRIVSNFFGILFRVAMSVTSRLPWFQIRKVDHAFGSYLPLLVSAAEKSGRGPGGVFELSVQAAFEVRDRHRLHPCPVDGGDASHWPYIRKFICHPADNSQSLFSI
jgi:hypothetical protein